MTDPRTEGARLRATLRALKAAARRGEDEAEDEVPEGTVPEMFAALLIRREMARTEQAEAQAAWLMTRLDTYKALLQKVVACQTNAALQATQYRIKEQLAGDAFDDQLMAFV